MDKKSHHYPYTIQLALISFLLFLLMFKWIHYLSTNNYVRIVKTKEGMVSNTKEDDNTTTHNVNMPLNTKVSCQNMCGPPNRCSITGQQCMADIDCPGCEPPSTGTGETTQEVMGENDSGKLSTAMTPNYSELTSDIGSRARLITADKYEKSMSPYRGINTWNAQFNLSRKLFDDRYKPAGLKGMPSYRKQYSLSGTFDEEGPLASNSYLS
jgi:hypothetical protein